jgi:hypothetical protein
LSVSFGLLDLKVGKIRNIFAIIPVGESDQRCPVNCGDNFDTFLLGVGTIDSLLDAGSDLIKPILSEF